MRRRKARRRHPRKILLTALTGGLIVLILVVTGVIMLTQRPSRPPERLREPETITVTRHRIIGEEALIKGCLFDLGIPRDKVTISGRSVKVSVGTVPAESRIRTAFGTLEKEDGVQVRMEEASRLNVTMNGHTWDIVFHAAKARVETRARVAIIVDDMGQDMNIAKRLAAIDADLTFAILPRERYTQDVARYLNKRGRLVLLHMPMEGNGKNPGQGAIFGSATPSDAALLLRESLELVPHARGVNNHMGSVVTSDRTIMDALYAVMLEHGLFFIDSLTTNSSVCRAAAEEAGLPFASRDVFLDNVQSVSYIAGQMDRLVAAALRAGTAIGICHPHQATYETLAREVPRLRDRGIEVVKVSELVTVRYQ